MCLSVSVCLCLSACLSVCLCLSVVQGVLCAPASSLRALSLTFFGSASLPLCLSLRVLVLCAPQRSAVSQPAACTRARRDLGINVLDTASAYLLSEERIGKAVADRRGEYFLATKCGEYRCVLPNLR